VILRRFRHGKSIFLICFSVAVLLLSQDLNADPSKYPQFAQQTLPENVTPAFIRIEELVTELKAGVKPVIIDVRTEEEYREAHILGAVSAPLADFKDYLKSIPRDQLVVLY
jgi:Rhodanese-like domain